MSAILLTADRWAQIWTAINADFPAYRVNDTLLATQGQEWYGELKRYSLGAVNYAWAQYRKEHERRPKLSHLLALCGSYDRRVLAALDKRKSHEDPETDPNRCPCGCGGIRWARVIHGRDGEPRMWTDGAYVTRDEIECKRTNANRVPAAKAHAHGHDSRGIPIHTHAL